MNVEQDSSINKEQKEIDEARAKLKKRFGKKSRIGGKGTQRRKKKGKPHITKERRDRKEFDFMQKVKRINKRINLLYGEIRESWVAYFDEWKFDFCMELSRKDIIKSCPFSIKWIKEFSNEFFDLFMDNMGTQLSCVNDMCKTTTFKDNYEAYTSIFTLRGFEYMCDSLEELNTIFVKKTFLKNNKKETDNETIDVDSNTKLLELSVSEIPSKKELRRAYLDKSLQNHPDKHLDESEKYITIFKDIKKAYKQLLEYYYPENKK